MFFNNPSLTLFQNSNRLGVGIDRIGGDFDVSYKTGKFYCGTLRLKFRIDTMSVSAEYNPYTGTLVNGETNVKIGRVTGNCSSFIGSIIDGAALGLVNEELILKKAIEKELPRLINRQQLTEKFALNNLFASLRSYVKDVPRPPFISPADYGNVEMTLDRAQQILSGQAFDGSGLRLDIELIRVPSQRLRIILSHNRPKVLSSEFSSAGMHYEIDDGFNTDQLSFYSNYYDWQPIPSRNLHHLGGNEYLVRGLRAGTSIAVIGESNIDNDITSRRIDLGDIPSIPAGCNTRQCVSDGGRAR